jgi:hypothetical protein
VFKRGDPAVRTMNQRRTVHSHAAAQAHLFAGWSCSSMGGTRLFTWLIHVFYGGMPYGNIAAIRNTRSRR